jgi:hypothetical protein
MYILHSSRRRFRTFNKSNKLAQKDAQATRKNAPQQ